MAGVIRNVRLANGKPYGDIQTEGFHSGETLVKLASIKPPPADLGLSHVAAYRRKNPKDIRSDVESVERVLSVDVVFRPATTDTFFERDQGSLDLESEMDDVMKAELATARTERDALKASLETVTTERNQLKTNLDTVTVERDSLKTENKSLADKVNQHETRLALEQRKCDVADELKAAGLNTDDKVVCSEQFLGQLLAEPESENRKALCADRASLLSAVAGSTGTPTSFERKSKSASDFDPKNCFEKDTSKIFG